MRPDYQIEFQTSEITTVISECEEVTENKADEDQYYFPRRVETFTDVTGLVFDHKNNQTLEFYGVPHRQAENDVTDDITVDCQGGADDQIIPGAEQHLCSSSQQQQETCGGQESNSTRYWFVKTTDGVDLKNYIEVNDTFSNWLRPFHTLGLYTKLPIFRCNKIHKSTFES